MALNLLQLAISLYVTGTCFCRLRKSDKNTVAAVRHCFSLLFAVSIVVAGSPWLLGQPAHWLTVLAMASFACVQWATGAYWRDGVPGQYIVPPVRAQLRRRSSDKSYSTPLETTF